MLLFFDIKYQIRLDCRMNLVMKIRFKEKVGNIRIKGRMDKRQSNNLPEIIYKNKKIMA